MSLVRQVGHENEMHRNIAIPEDDLFEVTRDSDVANYVIWGNRLKSGRALCYINGVNGQCGMCSLYEFTTEEGGRMRDILEAGEAVAKWLGYTSMMITLTTDQRIRAATEYGFQNVHTFINRRTNNTVHVLIKDVVYE